VERQRLNSEPRIAECKKVKRQNVTLGVNVMIAIFENWLFYLKKQWYYNFFLHNYVAVLWSKMTIFSANFSSTIYFRTATPLLLFPN
jgi:hypothetical protein